MELEILPFELTVCKVPSAGDLPLDAGFFFVGKTDEELSLVCPTPDAPAHAPAREDGWRGLRVRGELDFSLVGILSRLTSVLAEHAIPVFAVSTYNTDYLLVKKDRFDQALRALEAAGFRAV